MEVLSFMFRGKEYLVDTTGRIKANGINHFSDDWVFLGGSKHHWSSHIDVNLQSAFEMPGLLNGCLGWDRDHGTTRRWGGQYFGKLPRINYAHLIAV